MAALTLPTLVQNYQKKAAATRAKQAYSMISQALKLSEVENGPIDEWAVNSSPNRLVYSGEFFEKFIHPYLKAEFCGDGSEEDILARCGMPVSLYAKNYKLANGVSLSFTTSTVLPSEQWFIIDVNGPQKPNTLGKDAFYFKYYRGKGFKPYGAPANCTRDDLLNGTCSLFDETKTYTIACRRDSDDEDVLIRHGCTLLLFMDGWEVKDDYPW